MLKCGTMSAEDEESSDSTGLVVVGSPLGGMSIVGSGRVSPGEYGRISTPPEDASILASNHKIL